MPIDHAEATRRAREYFTNSGKPYASVGDVQRVAFLLQQTVHQTALECSEICRRHSDRAPGGLFPVGAAAKASDEIRQQYGLTDPPEAPQCPRSICQACAGTGRARMGGDVFTTCPRCGGKA